MSHPESSATAERSEPINLGWGQSIAAFWSTFWPIWIGSFFLLASLDTRTLEELALNPALMFLIGQLFLLLGQGILTFRLTRKNYRSFWVGVLHADDPPKRRLTLLEQTRVWLRITLVQVAFLIGASVLLSLIADWVSAEMPRELNPFATWSRILVVGPIGVRWAISMNYRGFRLQAYRRRRKVSLWSSLRNLEERDELQR